MRHHFLNEYLLHFQLNILQYIPHSWEQVEIYLNHPKLIATGELNVKNDYVLRMASRFGNLKIVFQSFSLDNMRLLLAYWYLKTGFRFVIPFRMVSL